MILLQTSAIPTFIYQLTAFTAPVYSDLPVSDLGTPTAGAFPVVLGPPAR